MKYCFSHSVSSLSRQFCSIGSALVLAACSQAETKNKSIDHSIAPVSSVSETNLQTEAPMVEPNTTAVRSADSHIHGGAVLSIVSEKDSVFVELETPLHNLLGFEYAPQTSSEKARVAAVETQIVQPKNLIRFNEEAKCEYNDVKSPVVLFEQHSSKQEGKEEHGHSHSHSEELDDHDDGKGSADHKGDHKDIVLRYSLTCTNLDKLKTVHVALFEYFPNFAELDLVYLGPSTQMSMELSPSRTTADLTR